MNKIATYLRGHLLGEVSVRDDDRTAASTDSGVVRQVPDMVIFPRTTNDIRKALRFSWQLAEKGHVLPVTARGGGTDATGAAVGKGVTLDLTRHMNQIYEYDAKQRLVRLQPGVNVNALQSALAIHGASIMSLVGSEGRGSVGGAIANGTSGLLAGKYKGIEPALDQLEVIVANGDVLQTKRISRRELEKLKGQEGFVGDIYRGVDRIIEEYSDVLDQLHANDSTGYNAIAEVKQKDGSFDLTPLFVGSQGTLGVIAEMIMKAEFRSIHTAMVALAFASSNTARDALDDICKMNPAIVEYFDGALFETATKAGRLFRFYGQAKEQFAPESVVLVGFDDFSERHRSKQVKKVIKMCEKLDGVVGISGSDEGAEELIAALDVVEYTVRPDRSTEGAPELFSGFHVPTERLEDFCRALEELALREHIDLPLAGHAYTNIYTLYPTLSLHKISDKQKLFKLLDELTKLVYAHGGTMVADGGEGRLKAKFIYEQLDDRVVAMYADIRKLFDPHNMLNAGVKQVNELRTMAEMIG